jgi:hypothetical protein
MTDRHTHAQAHTKARTADVDDVGDALQGAAQRLVQRRDVLQAQLGRAVQVHLYMAWHGVACQVETTHTHTHTHMHMRSDVSPWMDRGISSQRPQATLSPHLVQLPHELLVARPLARRARHPSTTSAAAASSASIQQQHPLRTLVGYGGG